MVKFCDTRFAQSELKVYINFEKNYNTYCGAWGVAEDEEQTSEERVGEVQHQEDSESVDDDLDEPVSVLVQREQQRHQQQQQEQHEEQQRQQQQQQQQQLQQQQQEQQQQQHQPQQQQKQQQQQQH